MLQQETLKGLFHFYLFNQKNGLWISGANVHAKF